MCELTDFIKANAVAIDAARKYADRASRGIPPDRWAIGKYGEAQVAAGIAALFKLQTLTAAALDAVWTDLEGHNSRTVAGMGVIKRGDTENTP